jgi:excisionase family DNA binding protein
MSNLRGRIGLAMASLVSLVVGGILLVIGSVMRQQRTADAGRRRYHGGAFERRWISDATERERHAEVVAERLSTVESDRPVVRLSEAADRLGVSVSTVRRRIQRGELEAITQDGRTTGVVLDAD